MLLNGIDLRTPGQPLHCSIRSSHRRTAVTREVTVTGAMVLWLQTSAPRRMIEQVCSHPLWGSLHLYCF